MLPSEKVVSMSLSNTYYEFLADDSNETIFKKFIIRRMHFFNKARYFLNAVQLT